jgi:hypothetical protein
MISASSFCISRATFFCLVDSISVDLPGKNTKIVAVAGKRGSDSSGTGIKREL